MKPARASSTILAGSYSQPRRRTSSAIWTALRAGPLREWAGAPAGGPPGGPDPGGAAHAGGADAQRRLVHDLARLVDELPLLLRVAVVQEVVTLRQDVEGELGWGEVGG